MSGSDTSKYSWKSFTTTLETPTNYTHLKSSTTRYWRKYRTTAIALSIDISKEVKRSFINNTNLHSKAKLHISRHTSYYHELGNNNLRARHYKADYIAN